MSEETLREACEAVIARGPGHDYGEDDCIDRAMSSALGATDDDPTPDGVTVCRAILAALDAEREAGRREALEEVREALARYDETPQRQAGGSPTYRGLVRLENEIRRAVEVE